MFERHRKKLVAVAVALVAVVVAAGAIAATGALTPRQESQAVVDDAAKRLGVEPSELSAALKAALKARVDAAVEAGRLTEQQATELKARIEANDVPLFGLGAGLRHGRGGHFHDLAPAAAYLGMTQNALRTALMGGKTLAQVARDRNRSVDGLVDALVRAARARIDQAVEDGRLTAEQRTQILADLRGRITAKVNGQFRRGYRAFGRGFGPPAGLAPAERGAAF